MILSKQGVGGTNSHPDPGLSYILQSETFVYVSDFICRAWDSKQNSLFAMSFQSCKYILVSYMTDWAAYLYVHDMVNAQILALII